MENLTEEQIRFDNLQEHVRRTASYFESIVWSHWSDYWALLMDVLACMYVMRAEKKRTLSEWLHVLADSESVIKDIQWRLDGRPTDL